LVETCVRNGSTSVRVAVVPISYQIATVLNKIFSILYLPIGLLLLPALYVFRGRNSFLALVASYSLAGSLMIFAYSGAGYTSWDAAARYPFLPVYSLLIAAGRTWKAPATALGFATCSLVLPTGVIQVVFPFFAILAVMIVLDISGSDRVESANANPHHLGRIRNNRLENALRPGRF
jgi:hypothetical protein